MKRLIFIPIICLFSTLGWSQLSLKAFIGKHPNWQFSELTREFEDTTSYDIEYYFEDALLLRPAVDYRFSSGNYIEVSGIFYSSQRIETNPFFSQITSINLPGNTIEDIGESELSYLEVQLDYYKKYDKLNSEKLIPFFGFGLNYQIHKKKFEAFEGLNIEDTQRETLGISPNFNTRLHYLTKNKAFQIQGTFGLNLFTYSFDEIYSNNLTTGRESQDRSLTSIDNVLDATWRIGISYTFSLKKKEK